MIVQSGDAHTTETVSVHGHYVTRTKRPSRVHVGRDVYDVHLNGIAIRMGCGNIVSKAYFDKLVEALKAKP